MVTAPPSDAGLRDQVAYLIRRLDEHLDEHAQELREALRAAHARNYQSWMLAATMVMSLASVVTVIATHVH